MFCPKCAAENPNEARFCGECGSPLPTPQPETAVPVPPPPSSPPTPTGATAVPPAVGSASSNSKKVAAGVLGILLGSLGVHKFYLGYNMPGVILLIMGTVGWFLVLPGIAAVIIGVIEGVIYLTKPDEEFNQTYVENQRPWF